MEKSKPKKHYWGITQNDLLIFSGTFKQCWGALRDRHGRETLNSICNKGIMIERIG